MTPKGEGDAQQVSWVLGKAIMAAVPGHEPLDFLASTLHIEIGDASKVWSCQPDGASSGHGRPRIPQHSSALREGEVLNDIVAVYVLDSAWLNWPWLGDVEVVLGIPQHVGANPAIKESIICTYLDSKWTNLLG
jgi:hypothetical protein